MNVKSVAYRAVSIRTAKNTCCQAVTEETLALDAIAELAAGADLSAHRHTQEHLGELWTPETFGRLEWWS